VTQQIPTLEEWRNQVEVLINKLSAEMEGSSFNVCANALVTLLATVVVEMEQDTAQVLTHLTLAIETERLRKEDHDVVPAKPH
jgi:hypothetical protein